jgi:osmotically-inducible protein OsmY
VQGIRGKTDAQIQQEVLQELKWDSRVDETDVGVEVDQGIVTLTGTVASYAKRLAAQEAAHRVSGVLDVANDVQVKIPGTLERTDTEIAQAVRRALDWDVLVAADRIQTTIEKGVVTLEGTVAFWYQREAAERAVHNLSGVRQVVNKLAVSAPPLGADAVKESIEQALERRAERTAKRIQVSVHDGVATLAGSVLSWQEKQAVLAAARFTQGVRSIEDNLRIEPSS